MSTVDTELEIAQDPVRSPGFELTGAREARVGSMAVRRLLPLRLRRSVGAWCFIDHYGPMSVDGVAGMRVPPHPHIGLQTVTWLISGNVLHRDSLGSEQMIRPGQLLYLGTGRDQVGVSAPAGSRLLLLGGVPLGERLLMWWNFVSRTPEEITSAAAGWRAGRYGTVADYDGEPLPAPPLDPVRLSRRP